MEQPKEKAARSSGRRCDALDGVRRVKSSALAGGFLRVLGDTDCLTTARAVRRVALDIRTRSIVSVEEVCALGGAPMVFAMAGRVFTRSLIHVRHRGEVVRVVVDESRACVRARLARADEGGAP